MPERSVVSMRLRDMTQVHPRQKEIPCSRCGELCGVYPSGQEAMARFPEATLICFRCALADRRAGDVAEPAGAPDAIFTEMRESVRKQ